MAQYGKRMAAEIPTLNLQAGQQLPVYQGYPSTKSIHNDYITTSMNLVDMKTVECSISGLRIESNVPPVPTQVPASIPTPPISVPQSDGSSKGLAGSVDLKSIPDAPLDEKPALPERTLTPAGIASHYHSLASSPLAAYVDAKTIESTNLNTTEKFHSEQLNSNQTSTATYKDIQPVDTRIPPHGIKTEAPSVIQASFPGPYAQPGPVQNTSHFHHSIIQPSHSIDYQQQNFVPSTSVPQYQHAVAPSQQPKPYSGPIQSGYYQQMPYQQTGYQQGGIAQQHPPRPSTHAPNYSNNIYPQQKPSGNAQPHYQGYQQTSAGFPPQAAQTGYQISNSNLQQTSVSNSPYYNRPMQHSHQIQRPPASTTYGQRPSHINQRPTLEYQQQRPPPGVPVNPAVQHPTSGKNENRYSVPKLHDYI